MIERQQAKSLTYDAIGHRLRGHLPSGYRDHVDVVLGDGRAVFEGGRTTLAKREPSAVRD